jgi:polyvinyl alcohol dehydrogenase (cytochrome)
MRNFRTSLVPWLGAITLLCSTVAAHADSLDNAWPSAGQNLGNTRYQNQSGGINVGTAPRLAVKWEINTLGDVSATPAVDGARVYFPDWGGISIGGES